MISDEIITDLAVKKQTVQLNIRREYFQHLFLSYFYRQPQTKTIFFKGGTAIRFIYDSPRFSEDLDFSAVNTGVNQVEVCLTDTLIDLEREGIGVEITESKKTTGGYLGIIQFQSAHHKVSIQLEISFREQEVKGEVYTIANDFVPPYTVVVMVREQLISQKISALLNRQKPRDFYDLYFILRANLLPAKEKDIMSKILKLLVRSDIKFKKELEQFLPRSHWPLVKNFKSACERELRMFI